jgi:putative tryptophan/tyrosine transport system substrate-binding protein
MMDPDVGRRKCLAVLGGTVLWPLAARAQPGERVRRVGILIYGRADNRGSRAQADSLREGLQEFGWLEGRNLKIELRYSGERERIRTAADELVRTAPDVIVANTNAATSALQQLTRTIPIVFAGVGDPVAGGLVTSLNRPGGNVTGITNLFFSLGGKWLELLKEIAPRLARVAIMYNAELSAREDWFVAIEEAAPMFDVTLTKLTIRNLNDIERAIEQFAAEPNGALIIVPPGLVGTDRDLTLRLARDRRLPAIYPARAYSVDGGLMSYGPDGADLFRQAATYVDRILRGAKPGEMPVQFPNKFELVINRGTAKSMGLDIPPMLLARADELIE